MKSKILFLFYLLFNVPVFAFQPNPTLGGRSAALGGIGILPDQFWSVFNNQAGLATANSFAFGIAYDSYFGIDQNLSSKSVGLVVPTNSGSFGLTMNYFGYSAYHEQKIGLAYGKQLGPKISVGLQMDYLSVHIGNEYGNASAITFEAGLQATITDEWTVATHIYNPFAVKIGEVNPEITPATFKLATSYLIDKQILILSEYEQSIDDHGILKAGIEYQLIDAFVVRAGVATNPNLFSFGFGLNLKGLHLDIGTKYHQTLGFSPVVSLHYLIN